MLKALSIAMACVGLPLMAYAAPEATAPSLRAAATDAPAICEDVSLSVYFTNGETALSPQARAAVKAMGAEVSECAISNIRANVLATDGRDLTETKMLAEARLAAVVQALEGEGLNGVPLSAELGADTPRKDVTTPMGRRVTVHLSAFNPYIG
ncbi:MAG: hypothetical protein AAGF20_03810 [Pseudomonadota bacterium]